MKSPKVFGIGFHKTGTTSLAHALTILGYRVTGPNGYDNPRIAEEVEAMAKHLIAHFDGFQDNPWPVLYKQIDSWIPDARFILTLRPEEEWINSVVNHFGDESTPMRAWIYGYNFASPRGNERTYLERFRKHNQEVVDHFKGREHKLLIMNITEGDGWDSLCPFLGCAKPGVPFPHANRRLK